ncbi:efflux RND transporter periplasmic adaptor subunit [Robertmurraya sp. DFI.2.37]|uniref:efflux RND transporter periplasmic adaptor subunit n=1 Tax=Robertmurraya sp. DFI.2.37 TaxID=3031819 RepID=UPI0023DA32F0|nr:efflux RND transporter periplasmic adaptor subunit [Robertmurraya sp. DFI.2.37]MDF1510222.1 efflux RND transporter periplasmic adaptor subunit [Robertmurraya sp. DFI.2.37]
MKKKIWIGIGVATLIILMVGVSVYRTAFAKPLAVEVMEVKREKISSSLMVPGTLELQEEQSIFPSPELGKVEEILVEVGQKVKKGDVLVRFDNTQLSLEIEQNKISVESGYLRINQLQKQKEHLDSRKKELTEQIGKKEAEQQLAPEYDQIETEKRLANLDLKQTLLQKEALEERIKDFELSSLVDGIVLTVNENMTELVTEVQEPLVQVGSLQNMIATGSLSEYDVLKVRTGQKVIVKSDVLPNEEWQGEIIDVANVPQSTGLGNPLENQAVQFPIIVQINGGIELKPGFQLIMEIETEEKEGLVISSEAIIYEDDKTFVYLVNDGIAHKQEIEIGITSGERMEVVEGLKAEDMIVLNPSDKVSDGMEVTVE